MIDDGKEVETGYLVWGKYSNNNDGDDCGLGIVAA